MRKMVVLALASVVLCGTLTLAGPKVLIVDQTTGFMESMQVGVLARVLKLSPFGVEITGTTEIPKESLPQGPFQLVVIVPQGGKWVWVCTPGLPERLDPQMRALIEFLEGAVAKIFQGERIARDPGDDLLPFIWSFYFVRIGVLGGVKAQ